MQCNIDQRGRSIRQWIGIACLAIAVVLLYWGIASRGLGFLITGAVFGVAGVFCVYQARAGYCVIRGMGMKTPF